MSIARKIIGRVLIAMGWGLAHLSIVFIKAGTWLADLNWEEEDETDRRVNG